MNGTSRERKDFWAAAILLSIALAIGGAGPRFPLLEMTVELAALAVLVYLGCTRGRPRFTAEARFPLLLLALMLLLPLAQLVPLPPDLWRALPGRELAARITDLAALGPIWRPLSLDPEATRRAWLTLLPGAAMFLLALRLPFAARLRLLWLVPVFAIFGICLGALQLASGNGAGVTPYPSAHSGNAIGLFTNRNHQATFLLVSIVVAAAAGAAFARKSPDPRRAKWLLLAVIALLALGVIVTTSRMGALLLPLALLAAALLVFRRQIGWRSGAIGAGAVLLVVAIASQSAVIERTFGRFSRVDDARFLYWQDTLWALKHYLPAGSGFGTFVPIYQSAELLSNVGPNYVNHAHNDYLELALEGGVPALVLLALFLIFLVLAAWRLSSRRVPTGERLIGLGSLAGIAIVLLHAIVDYPIRTAAISTLFALFCASLIPTFRKESGQGRGNARHAQP